jgi:hypothetical protein
MGSPLFLRALYAEIAEERVRRRPNRHVPRAIKHHPTPYPFITKELRRLRSFVEPVQISVA